MEISKARKDSLAAACVTGGALVLAYRIWKRYESAEFRCVGVVCELSIFPLKGCKGQSIETGTIRVMHLVLFRDSCLSFVVYRRYRRSTEC